MLVVSAWGAGRGVRPGAPYRRGTLLQGRRRVSPPWRAGSVIQDWISAVAGANDDWPTAVCSVAIKLERVLGRRSQRCWSGRL